MFGLHEAGISNGCRHEEMGQSFSVDSLVAVSSFFIHV